MVLNGEAIRELRISNGLTQGELGKMIGVNHSVISSYETGEHSAHPKRIKVIAAALGCHPKEILKKSNT